MKRLLLHIMALMTVLPVFTACDVHEVPEAPASTTTHTKRAARRAVFSGHAQRLRAVDASSVRCAQLGAKHHQPAVYLKPN